MGLAELEILQIVDPMHRKAVWGRTRALYWAERYRTGDDPLYWDYCGVADTWGAGARN